MTKRTVPTVTVTVIAAFSIPVGVMLLVFRSMGFYPLGDKSLLIMDMADQYAQFYEYLPHIVSGEGSIFFSWSKSFGSNFTGLFAYYLSSPLSLVLLLFNDIQLGIFYLTLLKIGLCATGSYFYFFCVHKCKGPAILLFTTAYALMSYNIVYSLSLMWLDAAILLPVILLGASKILGGGKPWLFIFSLSLLLISNYYTGYMVCLFSVIYTVCRYFTQPRSERAISIPRALGTFAGAYAAALGIAAWLLLPAFLDLTTGKIGYVDYTPVQILNFRPGLYIRSFLPQTYTSISTNGIPALYTGLLTTALCLFFFLTPRVRAREKLLTGMVFAVLLCSFIVVKIDTVWHIFRHPNWFPYRYAFVFQFFAISASCAGWQALSNPSLRNALRTAHLAIPRSRGGFRVERGMTLFAAAAPIILLPLACLDLGANAKALFIGLDEQFGYKPAEYHEDFRAQTKPVVDAVHSMDEGFYRMEKTYKNSMNDALGLRYRGITHYSSMFSRDLLSVTKKLGMAQTYIWNGYIGSTPATDALFGVKYVLSETPLPYGSILEQNDIAVYENPYVLPVAFAWDTGVTLPGTDFEPISGYHDCFAYQNEIYRALGGKDVFIPVGDIQKEDFSYTFYSIGKPVYACFPVYHNTGSSLYLDGNILVPRYFSPDDNNAVYIGTYPEGTQMVISFDASDEPPQLLGEYIYTLDTEALNDIAQRLKTSGLTNITYTASGICGQITAEKDGDMFISIPFDDGWTVKIDGIKVKPERALGAFMTVPLDKGGHTVELTFRPKGLNNAIAISALTVLCLLFVIARSNVCAAGMVRNNPDRNCNNMV